MPRTEYKEIDLGDAPKRSGPKISSCDGCGLPESKYRFVDKLFMCPGCRGADYKLIEGYKVCQLYGVCANDLMSASQSGQIRRFVCPNFYYQKTGRGSKCKYFYYENQVQNWVIENLKREQQFEVEKV